MKQTILHSIFYLVVFTFINPALSQVTIDESNFNRPAVYMDTFYISTGSILPAPEEGADLTWDYSSLLPEFGAYNNHLDASDDLDIPGSSSYYGSSLVFQNIFIPSLTYEAVTSFGWYVTGIKSEEVISDISGITGFFGDALRFPASNRAFSEQIDLLQFPATYGDQWTTSRIDTFGYELTAAAFGLDGAPGFRTQHITDTREVVGYGNLIIPHLDGTPTEPMEVLLVKATVTMVDTVYLGGLLAPDALMTAFGLVQGSTVTEENYFFYKPGFLSSVLFYSSDAPGVFNYRPHAEDSISGLKEISFIDLKSFPNPVSAGQVLTIQSEDLPQEGIISLVDLTGREIFKENFGIYTNQNLALRIPSNLKLGMYLYQVENEKGEIIGGGKMQVQ